MTATFTSLREGRTLISKALFDRLSAYIADNEIIGVAAAECVMSDTLGFLAACAANHDAPLSPSTQIDIGWHAFVLHTRDYAEFCDTIAGRFIHHVPTDKAITTEGHRFAGMTTTTQAINMAGFTFDPTLWFNEGQCSQCKNGCADDPPPGFK